MVIQNEDAIKLVDVLKDCTKIDQNKTAVHFTDDGKQCELTVVLKAKKKKPITLKGATAVVLMNILAWAIAGNL